MTLTDARKQMARRLDRYVVGYVGRREYLFGAKGVTGIHANINSMAAPLTLREARALLNEMPCADCAIFELRPVKVNRK